MVQAQAQVQVVGLVLAQAQAVVAALAELRVLAQVGEPVQVQESSQQVLARVEQQVEVLEPGWEQGPLVEL
jgi:hypothetical protein